MKTRTILVAMLVMVSMTAFPRDKKIVSFSWEWSGTGPVELLDLQPQIAATGLDGIGVSLSFNQDGRELASRGICENTWRYESICQLAGQYRKVTGKRGLTDCFLSSFYVPKQRFDWTDDASWNIVRDNMRLCARFAKESGFVGLYVDPEDYPGTRQFERFPDDPPMKELVPIVRRRGRELFKVVFDEFPNAKLFFFWFMTEHAKRFSGAAEPLHALRDAGLLWAFFANGILDAMPPTGRIYDGNECSYEYKSGDFEYLIQANAIREMDRFAYPENRAKYVAQVTPSTALFLEMYCRTNSTVRWYRPPFAGSRLGMFRRDLKQALDSVDEYIWTFGGQHPYVRRKIGPEVNNWYRKIWSAETYDDMMPGFNRTIVAIKSPMRFLDEIYPEMMCSSSAPKNLVSPDLSPKHNWQAKKKNRVPGTFSEDCAVFGTSAPAVKVEGVAEGCLSVSVGGVHAGEIYALRIKTKVKSGGFSANAKWERDGKWRHFEPVTALSFGEPDEKGWRTGRAIVTVPENVDSLALLFNVYQEPGEICWVDDAEIVRID